MNQTFRSDTALIYLILLHLNALFFLSSYLCNATVHRYLKLLLVVIQNQSVSLLVHHPYGLDFTKNVAAPSVIRVHFGRIRACVDCVWPCGVYRDSEVSFDTDSKRDLPHDAAIVVGDFYCVAF